MKLTIYEQRKDHDPPRNVTEDSAIVDMERRSSEETAVDMDEDMLTKHGDQADYLKRRV